MELDELKTKENLRDYVSRTLTKSKHGLYCCPACGSGTRTGGSDGALSVDGNLWQCFACGRGGSVIDLIMAVEGKTLPEATKRLRELYDPDYNSREVYSWGDSIDISNVPAAEPKQPKQEGTKTMNEQGQKQGQGQNDVPDIKRDFRNYFKRCRKRIDETSYPFERGLDRETVEKFKLGFDPSWISPTAEAKRKLEDEERKKAGQDPLPPLTPTPRLIIPLSDYNYLARDTRPDDQIPDWQKGIKKMNVGKDKPLFNTKAMKNPLCFFVVEGELDCMSIEQAGGSCVALGSTVKAKAFCELLQQLDITKTGTVIICLDNDEAGQKAADKIENACTTKGFDFIRANVSGAYKDPNEYLINDRRGFYAAVRGIIQQIRAERLKEYEEGNAAATIAEFMNRTNTEGETIPTGFEKLDEFLDGGLHPGLYFLGAVPSLGKTTMLLQMAEQIASNRYPAGTQQVIPGRDVIFFSLEQSKEDLISKSLSRRTYEKSMAAGKKEKLAKTNMSILRRNWKDWPQEDWDNFYLCKTELERDIGKTLRIIESVGDVGIEEVTEVVKRHIAITGNRPVLIIDYIQIMKPYDPRMTDKQNTDRITTALKRLSRDENIPIIGISSFNRENYFQRVSITSFKESGAIEYGSDVLMALAPANMDDGSGDKERKANRELVNKCKAEHQRKIELYILKNRNGKITGEKNRLTFLYTAMFNHFKEIEPMEADYLHYFDDGTPATTGKTKRL